MVVLAIKSVLTFMATVIKASPKVGGFFVAPILKVAQMLKVFNVP